MPAHVACTSLTTPVTKQAVDSDAPLEQSSGWGEPIAAPVPGNSWRTNERVTGVGRGRSAPRLQLAKDVVDVPAAAAAAVAAAAEPEDQGDDQPDDAQPAAS